MKQTLIISLTLLFSTFYSQSHHRKTRSDKGGHHHHSLSYYLKHGYSSESYYPESKTSGSHSSYHSSSKKHTKHTTGLHPHHTKHNTSGDSINKSHITPAPLVPHSNEKEKAEKENERLLELLKVAIVLLGSIIPVFIALIRFYTKNQHHTPSVH